MAPRDAVAAAAHADHAWGELAMTKLGASDLIAICRDLVAIHRAAIAGAAAPPLEYGECLPDRVSIQVVFTGDEKPIQALTDEGMYATDPAPETGMRDAYAYFPTSRLVELVALPKVRSLSIPDPGHFARVE